MILPQMLRSMEVERLKKLVLRVFKSPSTQNVEVEPYYRKRFRWWTPLDVEEFAEEFGGRYEIMRRPNPIQRDRIEIFVDSRREVWIKADTLHAFITAYKAILFQKEGAHLTDKDSELEKLLLAKYTHNRETPFI